MNEVAQGGATSDGLGTLYRAASKRDAQGQLGRPQRAQVPPKGGQEGSRAFPKATKSPQEPQTRVKHTVPKEPA